MLSKMTTAEKTALKVEIAREVEVTNVALPYPHKSTIDLLFANATEQGDPGRTKRRIRMSQQQAEVLATGILQVLEKVRKLETPQDGSTPH